MSLNIAVLIGRLTADPELRYTSNGIANCTFTLAVDRPFTNQQGEREADFIRISTWRNLAENCANHLRKGSKAAVQGRIQTRQYENNEGRKVNVTEVIADTVRFLERSEKQKPDNHDPFAGEGREIDIDTSDLPF